MKRHMILILLLTALLGGGLLADIPASQRAALIAFYNSTNGDAWTDNSGWKDGTLEADGFGPYGTENTWNGITTDAGNTTVERITLAGNGLTGSIPANWNGGVDSWEDLPDLVLLILTGNSISGSIPGELGLIADLQSIQLAGNDLTGSIPSNLTNLSLLTTLYLNANDLSGNLPDLTGLTSLRRLYLDGNDLTGPVPPSLGTLSNLQYIRFGGNSLSGSIPSNLGNLSDLRFLNISNNELTGSLPSSLGGLSNLRELYLQGNALTGEIPSSFSGLTALNDAGGLNIHWNGLYTNNTTLRDFLNTKQDGGDFESTQTIAPSNITVDAVGYNHVSLSWDLIAYTGGGVDSGYEIWYATTSGGPYTYFDITVTKSEDHLDVTGLTQGTTYYLVIQTRTNSHADNDNTVISEESAEVTATTDSDVISGYVRDTGGVGAAGVTLTMSGGAGSAVTDGTGFYSLPVTLGWTGTVTPSFGGSVFDPASIPYDNVQGSFTDQDYTLLGELPVISGYVRDGDGNPVTDVEVDFSGVGSVYNDASGYYQQTVYHGWTGTVTPMRTGFSFTPASRDYTNVMVSMSNQDFTSTALTSVISGRVTFGGSGVDAVQVAFSDGGVAVTDGSGNYAYTVPDGFTGTATPSHANYTFNPSSRNYSNVTEDISGQDYTATAISPVVSGRVTDTSGAGVWGVTLTFSNGGGSVTTGADGLYTQPVPYGWSGTVTPARAGLEFNPARRTYSNVISERVNQDYQTTTLVTAVIGRIINGGGMAVTDVEVNFTGIGSVYNDDTGVYTMGVPYGWTGTVTPYREGYVFEPSSRSYTNVTEAFTGQDFTAIPLTPVVSGHVRDGNHTGISGVTIEFTDGGGTTVTDANGAYSLAVPLNWNGYVVPELTGFSFDPSSRYIEPVTEDVGNVDFTAIPLTPVISGRVATPRGGGIYAVTLTFSGGVGSVTTDANGNYIQAVPYGWSGDVTPTKTGYVIDPASRGYANVTEDQTDQNYSAGAVTPVISGRVTAGGFGVPEVTLIFSEGGGIASTDDDGYYEEAVPYGWDGTVTLYKDGYGFTPPYREYVNVTADLTDQDYSADTISPVISGRVTDAAGNGVGGVTITATPGGASVTSDAEGNYALAVPYGWSGTITPSKTGYRFLLESHSFTNVTYDYEFQHFLAYPFVVVDFQASRLVERAWFLVKHYAEMSISFENPSGVSIERFILFKRTIDGAYIQVHEFSPASDHIPETFYYLDEAVEKDVSYVYKVEAHGPNGELHGVSDEITL